MVKKIFKTHGILKLRCFYSDPGCISRVKKGFFIEKFTFMDMFMLLTISGAERLRKTVLV